jgi:hypothetical protein
MKTSSDIWRRNAIRRNELDPQENCNCRGSFMMMDNNQMKLFYDGSEQQSGFWKF